MRVLIIVSDSIRGGATFSLLNLLVGLKVKGVEIHVVTPRTGYLTEELDRVGIGFTIVPFGFSIWPNYQGIMGIPGMIKRFLYSRLQEYRAVRCISSIAADFDPDIIHSNVSVINVGYRVAKKLNIPHVWHIREYGDKDFDLHVIPSRGVFRKRLDQGYSIAITNDLKSYNGYNSKTAVIYNGILSRNYDIKETDRYKRFIYVGRLQREKGVFEIINAFGIFAQTDKDYTLHFYGSCDDKNLEVEIRNLINDYCIQSRVYMHGHVTDIFERMQEATAIVVPSRCEGFGRITAEAMFNNCFVIGRNTGGTKEQLDNGVLYTGKEIGLRYENTEELIDAMNRLSKMSEDEIRDYTIRANNVVRKLYSNEKNVEETYDFFKSILS